MKNLLLLCAGVVVLSGSLFGQGFHSVVSANGTEVWAVGNNGNVWRSFDGGVTWGSYPQGSHHLRGIHVRGASIWIVGDNGTFIRSTDNGESWVSSTLAAGVSLRSVTFASPLVGVMVGNGGTILKSEDGGVTWQARTSGVPNDLTKVRFADAVVGYAVGATGVVLRTTDAGESWTPVGGSDWKKNIHSLSVSSTAVYVAGADGFCYRSTAGSGLWEPLNLQTDSQSDVNGVFELAPDTLVFVGGGGYVRLSSDGGRSFAWGMHALHAPLVDVYFHDRARGWACSDKNNVILRTTDGGRTWTLPSGTTSTASWVQKLSGASGSIGNTFCLTPFDKNRIYIALGRLIYMSTDRGETWTQTAQISSSSGSTHSFFVSPKDTNMFVVATTIGGDRVMRTTDRGLTWTSPIIRNYTAFGMPLEMDWSHPDTLIFAPEDSYLYRSTDFGATWSTLSQPGFTSPCDFVIVRDSAQIMWCGDSGPSRISRSTNGGLTWSLIYNGSSAEIPTIASSSLVNSLGYATAWSGGGVQKTSNYGAAWSQVATTGSTWGVDIAKDDPNVVMYGVYGGGLTYLSNNAGQSFTTSSISGSNYAILAYDRATFLAQQGGGVWKYQISYSVPTSNVQTVNLIAPNGGEQWQFNTIQQIRWTVSNISNIRIEYTTGQGGGWDVIAASVPASSGSFFWTIPNTPSTEARVRIADVADGSPADSSSATFSITAAGIAHTPGMLDFGSVSVGSLRLDTLRIVNGGTTTLVVSSVMTASNAFVAGRTSFTIPAGESDTMSVIFAPEAVQLYNDTLSIFSNAPTSPTRVPLSGSGSPVNSAGEDELPTDFVLEQNHPNPFNPLTVIRYAIPRSGYVSLKVYNTLGQLVVDLVDGPVAAGKHAIEFPKRDAVKVPSGVYFYRLQAGEFVETRKMLLLK